MVGDARYLWLFIRNVGSGENDALSKKGKIIWSGVLLIIAWFMWKERNSHIFEDKVISPYRLPMNALSLMYYWVLHLPEFHNVKYFSWLLAWDFIIFSFLSYGLISHGTSFLIKSFLSKKTFEDVSIHHIWREANQPANFFASPCNSLDELILAPL